MVCAFAAVLDAEEDAPVTNPRVTSTSAASPNNATGYATTTPVSSARLTDGARFPFQQADGHLETMASQLLEQLGQTEGDVFHNHPFGTCRNCDYYTPHFLQEGSKLNVYPLENCTPKESWNPNPTQYIGRPESPY
jgi:hypothetical protein